MMLYVLTSFTDYEGTDVCGVTQIGSVADVWLAEKPDSDQNLCHVYEVGEDGESILVETREGLHRNAKPAAVLQAQNMTVTYFHRLTFDLHYRGDTREDAEKEARKQTIEAMELPSGIHFPPVPWEKYEHYYPTPAAVPSAV